MSSEVEETVENWATNQGDPLLLKSEVNIRRLLVEHYRKYLFPKKLRNKYWKTPSMRLAFDYSSTLVCEFTPFETRRFFFWSSNFFITYVANCYVLVAPNLHTSSTVRTLNEFWFRAKKLFDARTRF